MYDLVPCLDNLSGRIEIIDLVVSDFGNPPGTAYPWAGRQTAEYYPSMGTVLFQVIESRLLDLIYFKAAVIINNSCPYLIQIFV